MMYLSQIVGKTVYRDGKAFGKVVDMAVVENRPFPPVSKIEIQHKKEKLTIAPQGLSFQNDRFYLVSDTIPLLPYDHKDFYLAEDLLDKQVIDTDGKRLVRVNDVVLEEGEELKVNGIDISFAGILRRLGLARFANTATILPWNVIEAFDYQTGTIKIKLKQNSLNTLHPADLADILEEVGTKERVGIVEALDSKRAARVLEEADEETQVSILESLKRESITDIVNKMHPSEIADILKDINAHKAKEIQEALSNEKFQTVKSLLSFSDDVAGGLMHTSFVHADSNALVKDVLTMIRERSNVPETIIVTNGNGRLFGIITTKDLLIATPSARLSHLLLEKKFVYSQTPMPDIIELFAQYNLRVVPVVDHEKKPIGIVLIDDILRIVQEEQQKSL